MDPATGNGLTQAGHLRENRNGAGHGHLHSQFQEQRHPHSPESGPRIMSGNLSPSDPQQTKNHPPSSPGSRTDASTRQLPTSLRTDATTETPQPQEVASSTPQAYVSNMAHQTLAHLSDLAYQRQRSPKQQTQQLTAASEDSQESNLTLDSPSDRVFTPPASQGTMAGGPSNGHHNSSQESQLFQLSQIAATQDRLAEPGFEGEVGPGPDADADAAHGLPSRKRMADGAVKKPSAGSPPFSAGGHHSRNISTVSMASTTTSTIGELTSDLKTRLSYAMVKLNNGWESHPIDRVETMASQAASPASSHSTLGRHGSSASPRMSATLTGKHAQPLSATTISSNPSSATRETFWRENSLTPAARPGYNSASPPAITTQLATLAPPASIEPLRPSPTFSHHPRRNSNPQYTPTLLSQSQSVSPNPPAIHHPAVSGPQGTPNTMPGRRPPMADSPHQNMREQDAIESLLFMSSPGNSANMKYGPPQPSSFGPSQQQPTATRHALPTSQPRKSLPNHRPQHQMKRVGFERSPGGLSVVSDVDMDGDSQTGTPRSAVRRRTNGNGGFPTYSPGPVLGHRSQLSLPSGLGTGHSRPRPRLADEDIERMLDRVAQADHDSSDDEEIQLPRRPGAQVIPG